MSADYDLAAVAQGISDSCGMAQESTLLQPTGRPPDQPLDHKVQINAINCMRATARERNKPVHAVLPSIMPTKRKAAAFQFPFPARSHQF
jgi:hypothetical protein